MHKKVMIISVAVAFICCNAFAMCGSCGTEAKDGSSKAESVFSTVAQEASMVEGVKEISYEQFLKIRGSGEKSALFDVLAPDSYAKGHIEGAASFPVDTMNETTAAAKLSKDSKIIVYCGSFQCHASTEAAKKLSALGYNVVDYKGGLKEWQEKGNKLVK